MDEKKLKNIEDYFEGNLSESDQKVFENQLREDKEFSSTVDLYQVSKSIIRANHRDRLIKDAQQMMDNYDRKSRKINPSRRILSIAAVLATLIAAIWVFQSQFSTLSPTELYANHFELPKISNVRGTEADELWEEAGKLYDSGNYKEATPIFESLIDDPSFSLKDRTRFYLGVSYLMTNDFSKSIENFGKVSPNSSFIQQAEWYGSLVYLKQENTQKARELLMKIANSNTHYKRKQAKEILDNLD